MEKPAQVNWGPAIFLISYQVILVALLPFYFYFNIPSLGIVVTAIVLLYLTGLSITGGYHRHYAHRSYRTNRIVETALLFFGSMAVQGSALRWAFDHRLHHAHVDTDDDPYSIKKGFWYAHFLWILEKPREIESTVVSDLLKNKLVMFQHHYYKTLMFGCNALVIALVGWIFNDYVGAIVIVGWLRLFALHHFTWFINSLAHTWGEKPFSQELSAVDNYLLSMLTFGEGYHNYHHTFANDYRNGIHWYHFDPTKWMIWTLNKLGLAYNLRRMDALTIKKKMVLESKSYLLDHIKELCCTKKDEIEKIIQDTSEQILSKISKLTELKAQYLEKKSEQTCRDSIKDLYRELKWTKKSLRQDWRNWVSFSKGVLKLKEREPVIT